MSKDVVNNNIHGGHHKPMSMKADMSQMSTQMPMTDMPMDMGNTMENGSTHDMSNGSGDMSGMNGGMMMVMHGGYKETIIFPGWSTNNVGAFIGSCIAIIFIGIAYEALKLLRDKITSSKVAAIRSQKHVQDTSENKLQIEEKLSEMKSYQQKLLSLEHIIQSLLHIIQFAISYFLMLAVMTYNWWICLSVLLGVGIGFYFFGVRRLKIDLNEDCH